MLVLGGSGYLGWNVQQHTSLGNVWADYRTSVGQRRRIELADGTQINLNTHTAIDVAFDGRQRLIRLREGEVLIHTGKRGGHLPFYVETRQGRVQALGTRFTVRQLPDATRVGVLEERVEVSQATNPNVTESWVRVRAQSLIGTMCALPGMTVYKQPGSMGN